MTAPRTGNRSRLLIGVAAAATAMAVLVGVAVLQDEDEDERVAATTTAPAPTTTASTTTTSEPGIVDPAMPVFPDPTTSRRFDDPVALAHAFAKDVLGFPAPIVGELRAGDGRSGEVDVRSLEEGAPTTVSVRRLDDQTWFVLGASTASIRLDTPEHGAVLVSPQRLEGAAHAFEGTVEVRLYVDGVDAPIAETFVTGSGDEMGPFSGTLTFEVPAGSAHGVLVLSTTSEAEDVGTLVATVVRVRF